MIVINKSNYLLAPVSEKTEESPRFVVVLKGTATLEPDGATALLPLAEQPGVAGDVPHDDEDGPSIWYATDLVSWKPKVDLILRAACHPAGGEAVGWCDVRVDMPGRVKALRVFGERRWQWDARTEQWVMTAPEPFTRMPLRWERAFGGMMDRRNPVGKGQDVDPLADPDAPSYPLPNVESPANLIRHPDDSPDPVGLAPFPATWTARDRKAGTRDLRWATFRSPRPPKDFDPHFYNAAPDDQQLERLDGYESVILDNLHAKFARFEVRLPNRRPRFFYVRADDPTQTLCEIPVTLDTAHIDVVGEQVTLIWRGLLDYVPDAEDQPPFDFFYVGEEPAREPFQPVAVFQKDFAAEAEIYQDALETMKISPEELEKKEMAAVVPQIVKVLGEAGASAALISQVEAAPNADRLADLLSTHVDQSVADLQTTTSEVRAKHGLDDDVEGS